MNYLYTFDHQNCIINLENKEQSYQKQLEMVIFRYSIQEEFSDLSDSSNSSDQQELKLTQEEFIVKIQPQRYRINIISIVFRFLHRIIVYLWAMATKPIVLRFFHRIMAYLCEMVTQPIVFRFFHRLMVYLFAIATIVLFVLKYLPYSVAYRIILLILIILYVSYAARNARQFKQIFSEFDISGLFKTQYQQQAKFTLLPCIAHDPLPKNRRFNFNDYSSSASRSFILSNSSINLGEVKQNGSNCGSQSRQNWSNLAWILFNHDGIDQPELSLNLGSLGSSKNSQVTPSQSQSSNSIKNNEIAVLQRNEEIRKYILKRSNTYRSQYQYLLGEINMSKDEIKSTYKKILTYIQFIVSQHLNRHKEINDQLKQLVVEFLDIEIVEENSNGLNVLLNDSTTIKRNVPFQMVIYKLIRCFYQSQRVFSISLDWNYNKTEKEFLSNFTKLLLLKIDLGCRLGINVQNSIQILKTNPLKFLRLYNANIDLLHVYSKCDLIPDKQFDNHFNCTNEEQFSLIYKSRELIMFLFVTFINFRIGFEIIQFENHPYFKQPQANSKAMYHVKILDTFENIIPYFRLQTKTKQYSCEYGEANYLSVIYFLLLCCQKNKYLMNQDKEITAMIQYIL